MATLIALEDDDWEGILEAPPRLLPSHLEPTDHLAGAIFPLQNNLVGKPH